jgi:hypothetical protein
MDTASMIVPYLIVIAVILGVVLLIKSRARRTKNVVNSGFSWAQVESEFYDLLPTTVFEMMAAGYGQSEVPELAMNRTADIIMRKYGIAMPEMVKFIERTAKNHR